MPKVHRVNKAQTNIWKHGLKMKSDNKQGYRIDHSKSQDSNDFLICKVGTSYYWWKFLNDKHKYTSKMYPEASQLTKSEFLISLYGIQTLYQNFIPFSFDELEGFIEDTINLIQELQQQTEDNLSNMPEQLQYSATGELLQKRIDSLEEMVSEFESVDISEENQTLEEIANEINNIEFSAS